MRHPAAFHRRCRFMQKRQRWAVSRRSPDSWLSQIYVILARKNALHGCGKSLSRPVCMIPERAARRIGHVRCGLSAESAIPSRHSHGSRAGPGRPPRAVANKLCLASTASVTVAIITLSRVRHSAAHRPEHAGYFTLNGRLEFHAARVH